MYIPKSISEEIPVLKWFSEEKMKGNKTMTLKEKQFIAAAARDLIKRLEFCEDGEFVDFVVDCVASADTLSLEPENLR